MTTSEAVAPHTCSSLWTTLAVVFLIISSCSLPVRTVDSEPDVQRLVQWQILTKLNFSYQIRLYPNLLLMVTVPWSGESRSLMKELAHVVSNKQEKVGTLKLMLLYRNNERMLADALGATEGITILYYHHSLAYKYLGRLRVQNILSSIHYLMSLLPEERPFKSLNTLEDLKKFLGSTDKALLLLEFCGWTPRLLAKGKNNATESVFGFDGETNGTLAAEGKRNQKGMENEKMNCGVDNGLSGIPWLGEFTSVNGSAPLEAEDMMASGGVSCTSEEFQRFQSFFPKFMTAAREFFLPPERLRFGLVPERSLLSHLGVGNSSAWLMLLSFAGCPSCSKVLRDGDDLKSFLQTRSSLVTELEDCENDVEPTLPANKPSILLFIDRSSDSLKIRRKSREAFRAFRELALHYQISDKNTAKPEKFSVETYQASKSTSEHPRLEQSPTFQKITLKDNLDKLASDLHGSSLREILAYILQHKKDIKLSSLAKNVGFELLSDDFDIKIVDALPVQSEVQSNQGSAELPMEGLLEGSDSDKHPVSHMAGKLDLEHEEQSKIADILPARSEVQSYQGSAELPGEVLLEGSDLDKHPISHMTGKLDMEHEEQSKPFNAELSQSDDEKASVDTSPLLPVKDAHPNKDKVVASIEDEKVEQKIFSDIEKVEQQVHFKGFRGSFFFSDGHYRLLESLTAGSKIPSAVIIEPISQQHYVFPKDAVFSYSSLSDFLYGFLNGSLLPCQRSKSVVLSPKEAPSPPFVNLDFREVDSIPQVTTQTFSDLVVGNQSDSTNAIRAWEKDVLVLFSNSWCGFCQRMELVVREVYRACKGYTNMLRNGSRNNKSMLNNDDMKFVDLKLPLIYLMDCTLNDCSLILKSMTQRELYPSLLLFPAERKNAVPYGGDMAVSDIVKFIADHGSNSHCLFREKGILWSGSDRVDGNWNLYKHASQTALHEDAPLAKDIYHEVLLKDRVQKMAVGYNRIRFHSQNDLNETAPQVVVGSVLIATDKLVNAHPFDKSVILIVKVNQSTGFEGLIVNKHISWDSLHELEIGLPLLKEASLSFGGPIVKRGMPLVALTREFEDQYLEVLPNIYFLDQWTTRHVIENLKLRNESVTDYWFFVGYSRWGWDQLFDEISEGAWNLSSVNVEQLDWPWR